MVSNCSVFGCGSSYKHNRSRNPGIRFYSFPTRSYDKERRKLWIKFVKRRNKDGTEWQPTKYSKICSDHFIGGRRSGCPTSPSYHPTIRPSKYAGQKNTTSNGMILNRRAAGQQKAATGAQIDTEINRNTDAVNEDCLSGSESNGQCDSKVMESDSDENEKKIQCFVCYESEEVKNFRPDSMEEIPLKIPESVIDILKTRFREDIVKSLKSPDGSFYNVFCKSCLKMTNEIFYLCSKLDELKAEIERKANEYTNRIISYRQDPENKENPPLIHVSQNCFEDDYDDGNDNSFSPEMTTDNFVSSNENDAIAAYDEKCPIISKVRSALPIVCLNYNTSSSKNLKSMSRTSTARKYVKISKTKKSGVEENNAELSRFGLKKLIIVLERISAKNLRCNICYKCFVTSDALYDHKSTHIQMVVPKCPKCERFLTSKSPPSNIVVKLQQCYMSCNACKKGFVFQKKVCKLNISTSQPAKPLVKTRQQPPKENSWEEGQRIKTEPEETPSTVKEKQELKTYQSKNGPVVQGLCKICNIAVLKSMLEYHMKHYHPNESVESKEADVEVVAVKLNHKLIVKKSIPPELPIPIEPEYPKEMLESNLKCMTCNNQLICEVPSSHKQQLQTMADKFPGRRFLYCSNCKKILVVGGKSINSLLIPKGIDESERLNNLKAKNTFKCHECSGSFATQYMAIVHRHWKCKNIKRSCHVCDKSFTFAYDLHSHVADKHSDMDKSLWNICAKCGDSYADAVVHELSCSGTLGRSCTKCAQVCPSDELLLKHIQNSHGQPRLIKCITKLSKDQKEQDERERRYHKPRRLCENCGKQFINYKRHIKTCGKNTRKKYECKKCLSKDGESLTFESKRKLKMHSKLYHVLVYKCDICARGFAKNVDLKRHRLVSHNIKIK